VKARTLFYCPQDENELLFEEVYDENREFDYQPSRELPEVCPKCGRLLFKKDCMTVEELQKADNLPIPTHA
jgi:NAD-dependent SIR2 family protein deacetylase